MPQILSDKISVPVLIDVLEDRIKCSDSQMFKISRNKINCEKESNLNAMDCDKLNLIENVATINDVLVTENINSTGNNLPIDCDTNIKYDNASGNKPNTTYLCHRCRTVFSSRVTFETHYK